MAKRYHVELSIRAVGVVTSDSAEGVVVLLMGSCAIQVENIVVARPTREWNISDGEK